MSISCVEGKIKGSLCFNTSYLRETHCENEGYVCDTMDEGV